MASLFWNSHRRDTDEIGQVKAAIERALSEIGFSEVGRGDLEVFGVRGGVVVSIAHFPIGGRSFFEVVMASGDSGDVTKNTRDEVVNKVRSIQFID